MTKEQAKHVRERHLQGQPVTRGELQQAIYVLASRRSRKMVLPPIPRPDREYANAVLCFRLGLAIGKTA